MKKLICQILMLSIGYVNIACAEYKLPPLPYPHNALEPYISENTMSFHYDKHHKAYVDTLNRLVKEKKISDMPLEKLIKMAHNNSKLRTVLNNAAQTWNHAFYWASMTPDGGGEPTGRIATLINKTFGSYNKFKQQFIEAGQRLFGSGWVWLVLSSKSKLEIHATKNADLPLLHNSKAILVCDIWEHAYYLDYQNRRKDYVTAFLEHLVNWDFANKNLG